MDLNLEQKALSAKYLKFFNSLFVCLFFDRFAFNAALCKVYYCVWNQKQELGIRSILFVYDVVQVSWFSKDRLFFYYPFTCLSLTWLQPNFPNTKGSMTFLLYIQQRMRPLLNLVWELLTKIGYVLFQTVFLVRLMLNTGHVLRVWTFNWQRIAPFFFQFGFLLALSSSNLLPFVFPLHISLHFLFPSWIAL